MAYKTGNPALSKKTFYGLEAAGEPMTLNGAVNKSLTALLMCVASAVVGWNLLSSGTSSSLPLLVMGAPILGFIVALVTIFKKTWAPVTTPIYVILEGLFLGVVSRLFEAEYGGIVMMAVSLTFGIFFCMLVIYKSGLIKVTENFKLAVTAATGGIALYYIVNLLVGIFTGNSLPLIWDSGTAGILFSVFVVGIAALNLVMDFDFIEQGAEARAPKYMEWYSAFGLMVTLIWLYLEILRLLAKARD